MADAECHDRWESLSLGYTIQQGDPGLREAVAKSYQSNLNADDTTIVCPQEGILLGALALLEPGDHVIATRPCYQSLTEVYMIIKAPSVSRNNCNDTDPSPMSYY